MRQGKTPVCFIVMLTKELQIVRGAGRNMYIKKGYVSYRRDPFRFWNRVLIKRSSTCWPFQGAINKGGYGKSSIDGRKTSAHRVAYEIAIGIIPQGNIVCHTCDNPLCCNPNHLFLGTHKTNAEDRNRKGRQASGSSNGKTKLTVDEVKEIKSRLQNGESAMNISKSYNVHNYTIGNIKRGITWRNI